MKITVELDKHMLPSVFMLLYYAHAALRNRILDIGRENASIELKRASLGALLISTEVSEAYVKLTGISPSNILDSVETFRSEVSYALRYFAR